MAGAHPRLRTPGAGVLGTLNPPAYLTWLAVALTPLISWNDEVPISGRLVIGLAAQSATVVLRSGERIAGELVDMGASGFSVRVG